jgi:hypothetical protein
MLQLGNQTPFTATLTLFPDEHGIDALYIVLCASFRIHGNHLRLADEQRPLRLADEFYGDPHRSSLRYPGEMHLKKPGTDILLLGDAAADGRPVQRLDVGLRVGKLDKTIRVTGDRRWRGEEGPSNPASFTRMPLRYERARGGPLPDSDELDPANPVGTGHREQLPNLEDPARPMQHPRDTPPPVGFGPLAPVWSPRRDRVGTYDDRWRTTRAPYLPEDFDPRYFHHAPADQVYPGTLRGGEPIELRNVWPAPHLRLRVPTCELSAHARIAGKTEPIFLHLETLLIEPGERQLDLQWRGALPCDKRMLQIERVDISLRNLELGAPT